MATAAKNKAAKKKALQYNYTARNVKNEVISGTITAEGETIAAKRLQAMGYSPLTVSKATKLSANTQVGGKKKVKAKHLAVFARQLSTMTDAGLPIVRALQAMSDQTDHPHLKMVLPKVQADVEAGKPLSSAIAKHEKAFPPLMAGMIAAGEVSGELGKSLNTVAETYAKEAKLRSKTIAAMLYPGIVLALAIVMVTGMLIGVVPRFALIFSQLGGELPLPTRALVFASNLMKYILPVVIVVGIAFGFWWKNNKNTRKVREFVDPLKLRIPIFGKFFQKIALARFSRTLSSLLNSGVPVIQALDITGETAGNIVVGDALKSIARDVTAGKPIAIPMEEFEIFPPLLQQMVTTGEETGALPEMLTKAAEFYENEVDAAAEALSAILEPIMIVFLAGIIGGMVIALYLPMFKIFDLIK